MELNTLNKLYLELSQVTTAKTEWELKLERVLKKTLKDLYEVRAELDPHPPSGANIKKALDLVESMLTDIRREI